MALERNRLMRKCQYCDKEELCGVGKDNVPVCEDHYDAYLKCKRQEIDEAFKCKRQEIDESFNQRAIPLLPLGQERRA